MFRSGIILVFALLLAGAQGFVPDFTQTANAEDGAEKDKKKDRVIKKAFKRTRKVLEEAQSAAKKGGAMVGRLRTAVIHQRAAQLAVGEYNYALAARLTMEARILAGHVLKANKAEEPDEMEFKSRMSALSAEAQLDDGASLVKAVGLAAPEEEAILEDLDAEKETKEEE